MEQTSGNNRHNSSRGHEQLAGQNVIKPPSNEQEDRSSFLQEFTNEDAFGIGPNPDFSMEDLMHDDTIIPSTAGASDQLVPTISAEHHEGAGQHVGASATQPQINTIMSPQSATSHHDAHGYDFDENMPTDAVASSRHFIPQSSSPPIMALPNQDQTISMRTKRAYDGSSHQGEVDFNDLSSLSHPRVGDLSLHGRSDLHSFKSALALRHLDESRNIEAGPSDESHEDTSKRRRQLLEPGRNRALVALSKAEILRRLDLIFPPPDSPYFHADRLQRSVHIRCMTAPFNPLLVPIPNDRQENLRTSVYDADKDLQAAINAALRDAQHVSQTTFEAVHLRIYENLHDELMDIYPHAVSTKKACDPVQQYTIDIAACLMLINDQQRPNTRQPSERVVTRNNLIKLAMEYQVEMMKLVTECVKQISSQSFDTKLPKQMFNTPIDYAPKRRPGRPPGSLNKKKPTQPSSSTQTSASNSRDAIQMAASRQAPPVPTYQPGLQQWSTPSAQFTLPTIDPRMMFRQTPVRSSSVYGYPSLPQTSSNYNPAYQNSDHQSADQMHMQSLMQSNHGVGWHGMAGYGGGG